MWCGSMSCIRTGPPPSPLLEAVLASYMELRNEVFANPAAGVLSSEVLHQSRRLQELERDIATLKEHALACWTSRRR